MILLSLFKTASLGTACVLSVLNVDITTSFIQNNNYEFSLEERIDTSDRVEQIEELEEKTGIVDGVTRYMYSTLDSEYDKIAYLLLLDSILNMEDSVVIPFNEENISFVLRCVVADYPEIFWLDYVSKIISDAQIEIEFYYTHTEDKRAKQEALLAVIAENFYNTIEEEWSDYEKVKFTYEYVAGEVDYVRTDNEQNIYGALIEGEAVCAGYSRAFQYLLNNIEIECCYISGAVIDSEIGHAWNMVKIDDDYYYVDVTFGDDVDTPNYRYLCFNDTYSTDSHTPYEYYDLPDLTSDEYIHYNFLEQAPLEQIYMLVASVLIVISLLLLLDIIIDKHMSEKKRKNEF